MLSFHSLPSPTQHVLGHLWQRGYAVAAQKWEVAAAAFTHLEQVGGGRQERPAWGTTEFQGPHRPCGVSGHAVHVFVRHSCSVRAGLRRDDPQEL